MKTTKKTQDVRKCWLTVRSECGPGNITYAGPFPSTSKLFQALTKHFKESGSCDINQDSSFPQVVTAVGDKLTVEDVDCELVDKWQGYNYL